MDLVTSHAIDLIEAAYDLEKPDSEWLPALIDVGAPILDHGLGIFGFELDRAPPGCGGGDAVVHEMHLRSLPADFPSRFRAALGALSPEFVQAVTPAGYAGTWSENAKDFPEELEALLDKLGYADLLGILAFDPNGAGVHISAPLPDAIRLAARGRERWQMLGAHIASGYRLRRAVAETGKGSIDDATGLPYGAEAVFDTKGFRIVESTGAAKEASAASALRRAARNVDRARGKLRKDDPERALAIWKALVRGRWSIVDWFDTDRRRFILARPNPPEVLDPRGLTEQECQVVTYILLGETNKLVAYRLGLSPSRVSGLLKSAMRKLGAKNKADLVQKLGPLGLPALVDDEPAV